MGNGIVIFEHLDEYRLGREAVRQLDSLEDLALAKGDKANKEYVARCLAARRMLNEALKLLREDV